MLNRILGDHCLAMVAALACCTWQTSASATGASGNVTCDYSPANEYICSPTAADPGDSGEPGSDSGGSAGNTKRVCRSGTREVPCRSGDGVWSASRQCWVQRMDPQPPVGDAAWSDHTDGAVYWCTPTTGIRYGFWLSEAPTDLVDPGDLADRAVESMHLKRPPLGATPLPQPSAVSVIGLPTWLWVDGVSSQTWGPITRSASAGSVTVTATARVRKVVWEMGDGGAVTCQTPGTEWTPESGDSDSPTCGYRYQRPGVFTIRATTFWEVPWSGGGQSGQISFELSSSRTVTVNELQSVVTG